MMISQEALNLKITQPENMSYILLKLKEKELWSMYVHSCKVYDFYHTWYYHSLERSGEPILFVFQHGETIIAIPLLRRPIMGTQLYDCTSVYGYAGPISNVDFNELDDSTMDNFKQSFLNFLEEGKNVSVFTRLHPLINHETLLNKFGGIFDNGKTIAIDLQVSLDEQRKQYRRQYRSKIRQLREKGYYLKIGDSKSEVQEFVKIYNANMSRVKAESYYHFDEKYFLDMLGSIDFESELLLLYHGGEITAGAFVVYSNNLMQFHLAATHDKFLNEGPMKLLVDEATLLGRERGMNYLHLGGGVGGREDSLFEFKAGFSNKHLSFKTWRYVADEDAYEELVKTHSNTSAPSSNFFPLYRESVNF